MRAWVVLAGVLIAGCSSPMKAPAEDGQDARLAELMRRYEDTAGPLTGPVDRELVIPLHLNYSVTVGLSAAWSLGTVQGRLGLRYPDGAAINAEEIVLGDQAIAFDLPVPAGDYEAFLSIQGVAVQDTYFLRCQFSDPPERMNATLG